jgi:hypothetical protein
MPRYLSYLILLRRNSNTGIKFLINFEIFFPAYVLMEKRRIRFSHRGNLFLLKNVSIDSTRGRETMALNQRQLIRDGLHT